MCTYMRDWCLPKLVVLLVMRSSVMSQSIGGFSVCNVLHHVCSMVLM